MKTDSGIKKILLSIIMVFVIFLLVASPHYTSKEVYKNFRMKKTDEIVNLNEDMLGNLHIINIPLLSKDSVDLQTNDIILFSFYHKVISLMILPAILFFCSLYRFIRRRNILVSESKNILFLVHYLILRDGNIIAPSYAFSS